jgi:mannose/cellobiose epimerase-like protein (N-acyl-D-glucosamine 2-epimerase family)
MSFIQIDYCPVKYRFFFLIVFVLALRHLPVYAQTSPFLQDPDRLIEYVNTNANFWLSVYDDARGGFYTNVNRQGQVISSWGRDKDVLTQSRDAYAMVRAFQMTGDETYLEFSRDALDFMYDKGWDATYGGWINDLSETGAQQNTTSSKTAFIHHYALLGPLASWEATGSPTDWEWFQKGYQFNETKLWDADATQFGYYDRTNRAASSPTGKSFNATVDAATTHAIQLYLLTHEQQYKDKLIQIADNILTHLVGSMDSQAIGFAEKYDTGWGILANEQLTIMGHVLKTAWVLTRINQVIPDARYVEAARKLTDQVLDKAYDHQYGGPYKDYNRVTGQMQLWGIADTTKAWWQMEQAITGGLEMYRTTRDVRYLNMADQSLDFFMTYFQDSAYGEVYADRTRRGDGIPQWGDHKGDSNKAAYHSIELGYYTYLYGHLFVNYTPATLYYFYDSSDVDRTAILTPVADKFAGYTVASVTLDGQPYSDFTSTTRTLSIPAGTTGVFAVVFNPTTRVNTESVVAHNFTLDSIYPNPTQGQVSVRYNLHAPGHVRISVIDMLGRVVAVPVDEFSESGSQTSSLSLPNVMPGVYSLSIEHEKSRIVKQFIITR